MMSIGETAIVLILILLLVLLLDFGIISNIRTIQETAQHVEQFFEQDRLEDAHVKTGQGESGRYG